jgi:hypothetical protein
VPFCKKFEIEPRAPEMYFGEVRVGLRLGFYLGKFDLELEASAPEDRYWLETTGLV